MYHMSETHFRVQVRSTEEIWSMRSSQHHQ